MSPSAAIDLVRIVSVSTLLVASALGSVASANPTPPPVELQRTFGDLPGTYVRHHRAADADRLVRALSAQGLAWFDPMTLALIDRHADRFKPLVLRAQTPPHVPDPGLQAWYRIHASPAEREGMNAVLRAWFEHPLARPEAWHGSDGRRTVLTRIPDPPLLAAQVLGDARDSLALPAIRAFRSRIEHTLPRDASRAPDWPRAEGELCSPRVLLDQALLRITDPPRAGFLCAGPDGQLEVHRRLEDLESMELFTAERYVDDPRVAVDRERTRQIWELLSAGSEVAPPHPDLPRPGLQLRFRDGLVARLALAESGHFYYWENCRVGYEPIAHVHAPALYDSLRGMLGSDHALAVTGARGQPGFEVVPDSVFGTRRPRVRWSPDLPAGKGPR